MTRSGLAWGSSRSDVLHRLGRARHRRRRKGLGQLFNAIDLLAGDPRPAGATEYGPPNLRRIHVGRYRALYELNDTSETIVVIHVGRIG